MSSSTKIKDVFEQFLKKNGFLYTEQRKKIFEVLLDSSSHLTMDKIREKLEENDVRFSRGTLYNSLRILSEAGVVSKLRSPKGRVYYEVTEGENEYHEHMICRSCDRIIEIKDRNIESFFSSICKKYGFRISSRIHEIHGICSQCESI